MKVAIVHPYLSSKGGAEVACASIIKYFANRGDQIVLFTCDDPQLAMTSLRDLADLPDAVVEVMQVPSRLLRMLGRNKFAMLGYALCHRFLKSRPAGFYAPFSLILSTYGELDLPGAVPVWSYIHYPGMVPTDAARLGGRLAKFPLVRKLYNRGMRAIAGFNHVSDNVRIMTNSMWTRNEIEAAGIKNPVSVVYGPVRPFDVAGARDLWRARGAPPADGRVRVVCLARLVGYKGQREIVAALDRVAGDSGHRFEIVFAGRGAEDDKATIEQLATPAVKVTVLLNGSRQALEAILAEAAFGVSAFQFEHFGLAVAELLASGIAMFVPDGGGQVEIVADPARTYADWPDFQRKVIAFLDSGVVSRGDEGVDRARFSEVRFHARLAEALGLDNGRDQLGNCISPC